MMISNTDLFQLVDRFLFELFVGFVPKSVSLVAHVLKSHSYGTGISNHVRRSIVEYLHPEEVGACFVDVNSIVGDDTVDCWYGGRIGDGEFFEEYSNGHKISIL
ncbi:hypothetical protein KBB05_02940 [Patescibacteria group bacterium]|jgi:hypothetical protein|nr:hypothetical protein [Patescibacteria group bacterium]